MTNASRGGRATDGASGRGSKDNRKRSGAGDARASVRDMAEEVGEEEEDRPGRLLHQAAIYNNVELLQVITLMGAVVELISIVSIVKGEFPCHLRCKEVLTVHRRL